MNCHGRKSELGMQNIPIAKLAVQSGIMTVYPAIRCFIEFLEIQAGDKTFEVGFVVDGLLSARTSDQLVLSYHNI